MMPKKPATSVRAAEGRAYNGDNESQDSQLCMDLYREEVFIGVMSSSPHRDDSGGIASGMEKTTTRPPTSAPVAEKSVNPRPPTTADALDFNTTRHPETAPSAAASVLSEKRRKANSSAPRSSLTWDPDGKQLLAPSPNHGHGPPATVDAPSPLVKGDVLPQIPSSSIPPPRKRKMEDFMSDSPTQSNEGRSYEQYRHDFERDPSPPQAPEDQQQHTGTLDSQVSRVSSSHEHRTLHEDETGAVKFDWQPPTASVNDEEADEDEDDGFAHAHHVAETPHPTSQPTMRSQHSFDAKSIFGRYSMPADMPPPETPVLQQRPFQGDAPASNVMGASQLFMQTQFTSGVKKAASPTSSRPSPNLFHINTISPNNVSSPLKDRGLRSSPTQGFPTSPAPQLPDTSSKPSDKEDIEEEVATIPGSPNLSGPRPNLRRSRMRSRPEPIGDYTPIRNSSTSPEAEGGGDTDSESDESQKRRHQAKLKRDKATRSLENISYTRQDNKDDVEVPSTSRRRSKPSSTSVSDLSAADGYLKQCHGKIDTTDKGESQETVADSQEVSTKNEEPPRSVPDRANPVGPVGRLSPSQPELPAGPSRSNETTGSKETIPETSPTRNRNTQGIVRSSRREETEGVDSAAATLPAVSSSQNMKLLASSPPVPDVLVPSSQSTRRSTRLRNVATPRTSQPAQAGPQEPVTSSSSLTALSETPNISSSTSPNTDAADGETKSLVSSPAAAKTLRHKPSKLKTYSPVSRSADRVKRAKRQGSVSTDELAFSTPTSATEDRRQSRSFARKSIQEAQPTLPGPGMFDGMTFATSFKVPDARRSTDKKQLDRIVDKKLIEDMIVKAGGRIISAGFQELFEDAAIETNPLHLKDDAKGFTALITDVHSRKTKYMEALALGLPCLSWKWVSACCAANQLVDWSPYLLCAGQSQVLGAISSRSLPSYDAHSADLKEIVEHRPKLLSDKKVLLVMKKARKEEEKRMPYVFLAQALGASLIRVATLEEARAELRKREDTKESFDWVYVDGHQVEAESILFGEGQTQPVSKKRKRQSAAGPADGPPPKRIRTLNDELVVQSLILGRLVEDGEMEDFLP
ncbi:hypothetical protein JX265_005816 [Neoarthrinium moseri]|uniref:BRCT domain-containing protein n=1 Tax=Neoarthrinium moseri TaxID=1658444 RepID=A0A9Q0AQA0_9PEZI|nr:hypothetical protein JX265_005816 [Neoarthrinium moseri]